MVVIVFKIRNQRDEDVLSMRNMHEPKPQTLKSPSCRKTRKPNAKV
jgi:hypothetical protein